MCNFVVQQYQLLVNFRWILLKVKGYGAWSRHYNFGLFPIRYVVESVLLFLEVLQILAQILQFEAYPSDQLVDFVVGFTNHLRQVFLHECVKDILKQRRVSVRTLIGLRIVYFLPLGWDVVVGKRQELWALAVVEQSLSRLNIFMPTFTYETGLISEPSKQLGFGRSIAHVLCKGRLLGICRKLL